MIRVLWDGPKLLTVPVGGVSRYNAQLLGSVADHPELRLLAACPPRAPGYPCRGRSLRQLSLGRSSWLDRWRLQRFKPDLFHGTYYQRSPTPVARTVQTAYDFIDVRFPAFHCNGTGFKIRQRTTLEEADAVIAISETTKKDVLRFTGVPEERIQVMYPRLAPVFCGAPPEAGMCRRTREKLTGGAPFWLWVGPRQYYKNFRTCWEAFLRHASDHSSHLVLVGGDSPRLGAQEQAEVIQNRIWDRVHILTHVPDEQLHQLYATALGLLQSSLWEGFGLPAAEALASGGALLLSELPVFHEIAGNSAVYLPPTDADAWAAAMQAQAQTPVFPDSSARADIVEWLKPRHGSEPLVELYQSLC